MSGLYYYRSKGADNPEACATLDLLAFTGDNHKRFVTIIDRLIRRRQRGTFKRSVALKELGSFVGGFVAAHRRGNKSLPPPSKHDKALIAEALLEGQWHSILKHIQKK